MKINLISKVGLVLIALGLAIFGGFAIWAKGIRTKVLELPMPIKAASVSQDFSVHYDALYTMTAQFDHTVTPDVARCLLGERKSALHPDLVCTDIPPLLKFTWAVNSDGKNLGTGSSAHLGSTWLEENILKVTQPISRCHLHESGST